MAWQDILAARGSRAALYNLRRGGTKAGVVLTLKDHFPSESDRDIRQAADRIYDAFQAGKALGRAGRVNPIRPTDAPWIAGAGIRPADSPDCRFRYDVTAQFTDPDTGEQQWVDVRQIDADHSLTPAELREIVSDTVSVWAKRSDTLPGGAGRSPPELTQMRVNFVFRC